MSAVRNIRVVCVLFAVTVSLWVVPTSFAGEVFDAQDLYRRAVPGVVWVDVSDGHGSGWVLDRERRLIVTNHHVIEKDAEPCVVFPEVRDGRVIAERAFYITQKKFFVGRVVMDDARHDLAIIRLDAMPESAAELPLAPEQVNPGQRVHSIGQPGASGGMWVYSTGNVRQVYTTPDDAKDRPGVRIVETSVPINPGDSGGPMVDDEGRVVGVSVSYIVGANLVTHGIDAREVRDLQQRFVLQQDATAMLRRFSRQVMAAAW